MIFLHIPYITPPDNFFLDADKIEGGFMRRLRKLWYGLPPEPKGWTVIYDRGRRILTNVYHYEIEYYPEESPIGVGVFYHKRGRHKLVALLYTNEIDAIYSGSTLSDFRRYSGKMFSVLLNDGSLYPFVVDYRIDGNDFVFTSSVDGVLRTRTVDKLSVKEVYEYRSGRDAAVPISKGVWHDEPEAEDVE